MNTSLTSANAIFVLTVETLFNAPITLENWSADRAWEAQDLEQIEFRMSMDSQLNAGYIPRSIPLALTFQPGSSSIDILEQIQMWQAARQTVYWLGAELTLPDQKKKYTLPRGALRSGSVMPSAAGVLSERTFNFEWERIFPVGI